MNKGFFTWGIFFLPLLLTTSPVNARNVAGETWSNVPQNVSFLRQYQQMDDSYQGSMRGGYIGIGLSVPNGLRLDIAGEILPYINLVAHFSWFGSDFGGGSVFDSIKGAENGIPFGNLFKEDGQVESPYWGKGSTLVASQWSAGLLFEAVTPFGLYARGGLMWINNQTHWTYLDKDDLDDKGNKKRKTLQPVYKSLIPFTNAGETNVTKQLESNLFPYLALGLRRPIGPFTIGIEAGVVLTDAVRALASEEYSYFDTAFQSCDAGKVSGSSCSPVGNILNGIPKEVQRLIHFLPSLSLTISYRF